MAKRKPQRRRRMGKYLRGAIDEELEIATLGAKAVGAQVFDETPVERTLISSIVVTATMDNLTPGTDIGPIMIGVANSDYTASEIEAWIENAGSWNESDMVQQREISKRLIRKLGVFRGRGNVEDIYTLGDGRPIKLKLNWILNTGATLDLWAYNMGDAPVATTIPKIQLQGHANLWPR